MLASPIPIKMSTISKSNPSQGNSNSLAQSSPILEAYSLQSGDHPGLVLISQLLQQDNYSSLCRSMCLALSGKHKIGFIDGSLQKPNPIVHPVLAESCQCTNDIVTTWLLNSISKDIAASVICVSSAALLWQDLEIFLSE
ncbi:uncharacterized protein DS421_13g414910 [Arachis hypogaea]|nr:uncharacterized protein DS421_13g414910 [Arachis hypogaea]